MPKGDRSDAPPTEALASEAPAAAPPGELGDIARNADIAADFLGGLASPHRLRILCQLADGEKSVSQLIAATGLSQTSMSQHLGKLKEVGIVTFRREHRTLYYSISNPTVIGIMNALRGQVCGPSA